MTKFHYSRLLIALIIVGMLSAFAIDWQRHMLEENNTTVELVMDYEDVIELAQTQGVPAKQLLQDIKKAGIISLAVYETTLEKLNKSGKLTVRSGAQIIGDYRSGNLTDSFWRAMAEKGEIKAEDVYIIGNSQPTSNEVKSDLERRLGAERVAVINNSAKSVLDVKANYEKVIKWSLGLPTDELKEVNGAGFCVIARPTNYTKVRPEDVNAVFERLNGIDVSGIMYSGEEILGATGSLKLTAEQMRQRGITLAMIEAPLQLQFYKQEGLIDVASAINYQAARVYAIPKDEQPKMKVADAVHRWVITDQERNIRINVLRKYDKPEPGEDLLETNLRYISTVKNELVNKGFTIGRASTFPPYFPSRWLQLAAIIGTIAAGVLYLAQICNLSARIALALLAGASCLLALPMLKGGGMLTRQIAALAAANIIPTLAMVWAINRWERLREKSASVWRLLTEGVLGLTVATAISLLGGLYVGAILSDVRFFLEIDIYRGVKLTFIGPLVLISLVYLRRYNVFEKVKQEQPGSSVWNRLTNILNYPVYLKTLIVLAFTGFAAWVFIGRSGHTAGVPVPGIEIQLRYLLEEVMFVRPREKEFLIGHPAFFLVAMAFYREWPRSVQYGLVVLATIGQGSMVETFAHLRTPVFMSLVRGLDGWVLGIALGIAAVCGVLILNRVTYMLGRRPASNE